MTDHKTRLLQLQSSLKTLGIDAFIQPYRNRFQAHFLTERDERIKWLSGFEGSAGFVVVTHDHAAVFYDQRYAIAIRKQVDPALFDYVDYKDTSPLEWLQDKADIIGIDPWLHSIRDVDTMRRKATITCLDENPIDALWTDRPNAHNGTAFVHPDHINGRNHSDKRADCAGDTPILINAMDSIAWLLNIRGSDVPCMPALESYALLYPDHTVDLFIAPDKITEEVRNHLGQDISLHAIDTLQKTIQQLDSITLDESTAPAAIAEWADNITHKTDPCALPKACKNTTEQHATIAAHKRDGLALTRFLMWLKTIPLDGSISELDVSAKLDSLRAQDPTYLGHSFPNIVGFAAHSASIHTLLNEETNQPINHAGMLLVDSGGQYLDGTTDVTRTTCLGAPSDAMRHAFTLVLKGHIALSTAHFPASAQGAQLDALARQFLWADGKDYGHGTGHGVGLFGDVHEGPCGISPGVTEKFKPGMLLSNEPGYYQDGDFGIRTENLMLVKPANDDGWLCFHPITLAPIDQALINTDMMEHSELDWLNTYHNRVYETHAPHMDTDERTILRAMTQPL